MGTKLRGGEIIELIGDLGAGKTAFVRGLARGMGSSDAVSSPSFTISNRYGSEKLVMHHFDFHRLDDPGIIKRELAEMLEDPRAVTVVEWGAAVEDVMPRDRVAIRITAIGDESRRFEFSYPDKLSYLMPEKG
jgi:tRNA threonylcarbamoyladenosine biosynthesis protein TsaE